MTDVAYRELAYKANELSHDYGENVHVVSDPFAMTRLARLGSPDAVQPEVSRLVRELYRDLLKTVVNAEFPRQVQTFDTRMAQYTDKGVFCGNTVLATTPVTTVDIARAGMLPSQVCFDTLCDLLEPSNVRQDHLLMSRLTDQDAHVTGAGIGGIKLAGPIDGRIVLFPDPMGATGTSLSTAVKYYRDHVEGTPAQVIAMNLIITPEYIRRMTTDHPDVLIYAYRLDRGLSSQEVLATRPGSLWSEERGLTENHYIVPGAGGLGEILNNALE